MEEEQYKVEKIEIDKAAYIESLNNRILSQSPEIRGMVLLKRINVPNITLQKFDELQLSDQIALLRAIENLVNTCELINYKYGFNKEGQP